LGKDFSLLELWIDDLQPSDTIATVEQDDSAVEEISHFQWPPNIAVTQCPLAWWLSHSHDPRILEVAHHFLAAPSAYVANEWHFHSSGVLYGDSCSCMDLDKDQVLLFIKYYVTWL
jgi:hypothetical protein